ncbi:MAG: hypothetical protein WED09_06025 [Homoserinimonas sp.]
MIVETIVVLAMLAGGAALVRIGGLRGWGVPVLGAVAGISAFIAVGIVQLLLPVTTSPILTIALTAGIPLTAWLWLLFRRKDVGVHWLWALLAGLGAIGGVAIFRMLRLSNWSYDSIQYILNGALIASDNFDEASTGLVPKRLIGVPLIHAAGNISGDLYLPSITPLISGLIIALIAWLSWTALSRHLTRWMSVGIIATGLLLLISINRFIFHSFYINGHLLFGLLLLAVVGCSWLLATDDRVAMPALLLVVGLASIALVVIRAEGCIAVALAILPIVLDETTPVRFKTALLASVGATVIGWQSFVAVAYLDDGLPTPFSVYGLLLVGVVMLGAIPILRWTRATRHRGLLLLVAELGLWLVLVILFLREPEMLIDSLDATVRNTVFGAGSWGLSLVMLLVLMVIVLCVSVPESVRLRFPLTTFVPFAFILAYLRDAAYRVGDGDSLNRMWMQLVPLVVLYLVLAIGAGRWRPLRWSERSSAVQSPPL